MFRSIHNYIFKPLSKKLAFVVGHKKIKKSPLLHPELYDIKTRLPNRYHFESLLNTELKHLSLNEISSIAMMVIGIGRLDEINNTLGHSISDLLLLDLVDRLCEYDKAIVLARFSDDEMVLLINNQSMAEFIASANEIHNLLEAPYHIESFKIDISPYIGLCMIETSEYDANVWLRRGHHVLYLAKQQGLSILAYEESMDQLSSDRLAIMGDLVNGIKNNQFELWFQPKVSLSGKTDYYVEALVRWRCPNRGLVKPEDFIELAEKTGHIWKLTKWVLDQTCQFIQLWIHQGYKIKVAVNISSRDLFDERLISFIRSKISQYDIPTNLISLEITESDMINNLHKAQITLEKLSKLGISIAIDDFGVGYSSFVYLKELPVDEIKIDKSFITRLNDEPESAIIVGSIIELAHKMGLSVVAEGAESKEVVAQLQSHQCDYVQGHYYSEPLQTDQLLKWIKNNR